MYCPEIDITKHLDSRRGVCIILSSPRTTLNSTGSPMLADDLETALVFTCHQKEHPSACPSSGALQLFRDTCEQGGEPFRFTLSTIHQLGHNMGVVSFTSKKLTTAIRCSTSAVTVLVPVFIRKPLRAIAVDVGRGRGKPSGWVSSPSGDCNLSPRGF